MPFDSKYKYGLIFLGVLFIILILGVLLWFYRPKITIREEAVAMSPLCSVLLRNAPLEQIETIIKCDPTVINRKFDGLPEYLNTPLKYAACMEREDVVVYLIQNGANCDKTLEYFKNQNGYENTIKIIQNALNKIKK